MEIINSLANLFRKANFNTDKPSEFDELIEKGDIDRIKEMFTSRESQVSEALREYDPSFHDIMRRQNKIVKNKEGERIGEVKRWKLPVNYPQYINEVAVTFLYGQPVKWSCQSEGTDEAFSDFQNLIKSTRFDSKIRQCKRLAGAETQSAMLFHVFRNKENKPDCLIRVLARSKGDEIYTRWDLYENLVSVAWGYYTKDTSAETTYHFDIFTADTIFRCVRGSKGWEVTKEANMIGKIPIILFEQQKEWAGVERLIEREEYIGSRTADTNDYFSDPYLVLNSDIVRNLPDKAEEAKVLKCKGNDSPSQAAAFLTWDNAPASKQHELEWLQKHILSKTFTPNIDFEQMKGLSNVSGKALKQMMLLADIKASRHKETHDELLDRTANLMTAIIANVQNVALKPQCDQMKIAHTFQEPFGEDISAQIDNLVKAKDAELISTEGAVELNPLVRDKVTELKRIEKEAAEAEERKRDLFGTNQTQEDIFGGAE